MALNIMVRVACWEHELVVHFQPADEPLFVEMGLTEGVVALYEEGTILIAPQVDGHRVLDALNKYVSRDYVPSTVYTREFCFDGALRELNLVRFRLTEFEAVLDVGYLTVRLPCEHELPWFVPTGNKAERSAICQRELRRRMRSAVRHGAKNIDVPGWVRHHVPPGMWSAIMREVGAR